MLLQYDLVPSQLFHGPANPFSKELVRLVNALVTVLRMRTRRSWELPAHVARELRVGVVDPKLCCSWLTLVVSFRLMHL